MRTAIRTALPGKERKDGTRRDPNPGGAAVHFAKRYVPGSNLWYLRAAWERMVIDQLDAQFSNTHERDAKRRETRLTKNHQGQWWKSDDPMPDRAPDWGNVVQGAD
jgi:hypothetical protein